MEIKERLLTELQKRLKVGNRKSVHLNAIPGKSIYKFDLSRLAYVNKDLPNNFVQALLNELPFKFIISWKNNIQDLNSLFEEEQLQLVKITKGFQNLINQTEVIESEKGINTFGFGFPIIIRRDRLDNKLTVAPILIWLLKIKQTKGFNTWEITRDEDDAIYLNEILINHLNIDSNIEIGKIPEEMLDDGIIRENELVEICTNLIKEINLNIPEDIFDSYKNKIKNIVPINDRNYYEKLPLNHTNAFIDFGGLFSIFEIQKQNIINDYDYLIELQSSSIEIEDFHRNSFQSITCIKTDPSQQCILNLLEKTRNILIQGPPGTGKSQTLSAILINALENSKKTIVVCEKQTPLVVLHKAIFENGLDYCCVLIKDIIKDRKIVVDSVRERIENSSYKKYRYLYSKDALNNLLMKVKGLINSINNKHKKLDEKILENKGWTTIVGELLKVMEGNEQIINLDVDPNIFSFSNQELNSLLQIIQKGQSLYKNYLPFLSMSFLNTVKLTGDNPYIIEREINDSFDYYLKALVRIKELVIIYKKEYSKIRWAEFNKQKNEFREINKSINEIVKFYVDNDVFFDEEKTNKLNFRFQCIFSKIKKGILHNQKNIEANFSRLEKYLLNSKDLIKFNSQDSIQSNLLQINSISLFIEKLKSNFQEIIEKEYIELNLFKFDLLNFQTDSLKELKRIAIDLKKRIDTDDWIISEIDSTNLFKFVFDLEGLINKKNSFFFNNNDLFTIEFKWFQFYNQLNELDKTIINELKQRLDWEKSFLIFYFNSMLIKYANANLPTNDEEHLELSNKLNGIEKEQLKFIRELWYSKQIDAAREFKEKNINLSVENLYNKKGGSKFKRLSLRQIVQYDLDLFTTFFPIILTTPDVCSNLFKKLNGYFDIVMFDEASQLRLEDNLPAILKGKQIIIAGDEHQMPPSNYFSKVFDGTIEDEDDLEEEDKIIIDKDDILLSCDSLLDFGEELNFEKKYLDFHYRSRHPYLIDFSNFAFYNQRLKPIPNDFNYLPIKYIQVDGTFSDYTNEAEAEMVLSIIENNINRLPNGKYPSVGVATFNISQRNLIKGKIYARQIIPAFSEFNAKIKELEENGMFIKNLENIQGDERDVIILSTTYGLNKDNKFTQRFGPLNHSKGYKLLNVIITRAKYKIYVCSSVPQQIFMNYREYLNIESANNRRAVFYAYLAYCTAVSEGNNNLRLSVLNALSANTSIQKNIDIKELERLESPFEEEVYQALLNEFGKDKLFLQFKYAGFRIDIVYNSPIVNVPKIAIECDGAKYHSSDEAYLYDLHRQKILESHGFIFHRIWSTNWWRNPKRETTKLIEFIKKIELYSRSKTIDYSIIADAFNDQIVSIANYFNKKTFQEIKDEIKIIRNFKEKEELDLSLSNKMIRLNSKIKIKYINNNTILYIHIVDSKNINSEISNGYKNIDMKSPLAVSILGHIEGDIVKVDNLDNFVEILKVSVNL
jgi:superfamily I DNA and/or RNA helicase/very-short-patch-repair endonuclease